MFRGSTVESADPMVRKWALIKQSELEEGMEVSMLTAAERAKYLNMDEDVIRSDYKFHCKVCDAWVGSRTKHCGSCDKCIVDFDHHCEWFNNCVGSPNMRTFLLLISVYAVHTVLVLVI